MSVFWSLIFVMCVNGQCDEWVIEQVDTIQECSAIMLMYSSDALNNVDKPSFILSCEQNQVVTT